MMLTKDFEMMYVSVYEQKFIKTYQSIEKNLSLKHKKVILL